MSTNKTLFGRLSDAMAEMKNPVKDTTNTFFKSKYATLDAIIDQIRVVTAKHGFAITQMPTVKDGVFVLKAMAVSDTEHQDLGDYPIKPTKEGPQDFGSAITYARRYQLCAIMGIAAEEDDDGNAGSAKTTETAKQAPKPQPAQQKAQETAKASEIDTMRAELMHVLSGVSDTREGKIAYMEKHWGISSVKDADEKTVADLHRRVCK